MRSTNAKEGINQVENIYTIIRYPSVMWSYNAPLFTSWKLKPWCHDKNITLLHSSAYFPQSNRQAGRSVQDVKVLHKQKPQDVNPQDWKT